MNAKAVLNEFDNITCTDTNDYTNWTNEEIAGMVLYSAQAAFEIKVIVPILFVIGVFENAAFFLLLARVKTMRTITNFYLANLATADLMIFTLQTMFHLWSYRNSIVTMTHPFHTSFGCISFFFWIQCVLLRI